MFQRTLHIFPAFLLLTSIFVQSPSFSEEPLQRGNPPSTDQTNTSTQTDSSDQKESDNSGQSVRREMLFWHQAAGMTAWALWLATNLAGENALKHLENPYQKYSPYVFLLNQSNPSANLPLYLYLNNQKFWDAESGGTMHKSLAGATFTMYAVAAGLALFAPSRLDETERDSFDTVSIHKSLAIIHFAAMAALPFLGARIQKNGPQAARQMQEVGWAGFTAFSASFIVFYF